MTNHPHDDRTATPADAPRVPLWRALRRRRTPFLLAFATVTVAVLLSGPFWPRQYVAQGHVRWDPAPLTDAQSNQPYIDIEPLATDAETPVLTALADGGILAPGSVKVAATTEGPVRHWTFSATADRPTTAHAALKDAIDRHVATQRQRITHALDDRARQLRNQADTTAAALKSAQDAAQSFANQHPAVLPEHPTSVVANRDRLQSRLEDRTARLRVLEEQITRVEAYAEKLKTGKKPTPATAAAPAIIAAEDPEVLQLRAQVNLLQEQLDEQLGPLRRTEQHPYVVNLREKLAATEKKMEAAQARAAAGQPPPAGIKPPPDNAHALALQTVELQLQAIKSEREAVAGEVAALTGQLAEAQKAVEALGPLRKEWSALSARVAAAQAAHQQARSELTRFESAMRPAGRRVGAVISGDAGLPDAWPVAPSYGLLLTVALSLGLATGLGAVFAAQAADRTFTSAAQFRAVVDAPVLGVVDEILSRGQQVRHALWRRIGRPGIALLLLAVLAGAAWWSWRSLGDASFQDNLPQHNLTAWATH